MFVLATVEGIGVLFLVGLTMVLVGVVAVALIKPCPGIRATLINDSLAEFVGVSPKFLEQMKAAASKT